MPRTVRDALAELADDLQHVRITPAAEIRARGRRRTLRNRAAVAGSALLVAVAAATGTVLAGREPSALPVATGCAAPVDLTLPDSFAVPVRVIDRPADASRAEQVAADLRGRSVDARVELTAGPELPGRAVGVIRYGPQGIGEALMVDVLLLGQAEKVFVPARAGETVDLEIGPGFQQLATRTEVNQGLAAIRVHDMPHEC
ncbi:hypothetical protein [Actinoplanes sp. DH11]|uniref:hypothetical protein n=1 Tax=Actinoplanes sp. DH11 TaxID=2857011 RepID=UPI001E2AB232|nr:hypothetical protein [Actinoplanes sp. DH11]